MGRLPHRCSLLHQWSRDPPSLTAAPILTAAFLVSIMCLLEETGRPEALGEGIFHVGWRFKGPESRNNLFKAKPWFWRKWAWNPDFSRSKFNETQNCLLTNPLSVCTFRNRSIQIAQKMRKRTDIAIIRELHVNLFQNFTHEYSLI